MSTNKRRGVRAYPETCGCNTFEPLSDYWLLPRTAEAYDAMVEQMAKALTIRDGFHVRHVPAYRYYAHTALRAIGITRPKQIKEGK